MKRYYFTLCNDIDIITSYEEGLSIGDINKKIFKGQLLTLKRYEDYENMYISIITNFLRYHGIINFKIMYLEKNFDSNSAHVLELYNSYPELYNEKLKSLFNRATEGMELSIDDTINIIRLILRDNLWCILYSCTKHFIIHFDFDYRMDIVCDAIEENILNTFFTQNNIKDVHLEVKMCI